MSENMADLSKSSDSGYIEGSSDRSNSSGDVKAGRAARPNSKNEVTFVDNVDRWKCPLCIQVLRDPVQTLCGHRCCETCLNDHITQNGDPSKCPVGESDCEMVSIKERTLFKDASARREILNLLVKCLYHVFGCREKIEWRKYEEHIRHCNFKRWPCVYQDNGCPEMLKDNDFANHVKMCKYQPRPCTICKQVDAHEAGCPNRSFSCTYQPFGCRFEGTMPELEEHSKQFMPQHLEMSVMSVNKMVKENEHLKAQLKDVTNQNNITQKKIEHLEKENKEMVEKMRKMETTMSEQNGKFKQMETRVTSLSHDLNTQQIELNSLQNSGLIQREGQGNASSTGRMFSPFLEAW